MTGPATLDRLVPLFGELGDLKRIRVAGAPGSLASRSFARAWGALLAGEPPRRTAAREVARALAAARLGGIDAEVLGPLGLADGEIAAVLDRAVDAALAGAGPLNDVVGTLVAEGRAAGAAPGEEVPAFVGRLADQPRAGATCPGRPRLIVDPPEDHAEHCGTTALYAALLAGHFGADPAVAWLAGLAHHLHNAQVPDAGFAGEELLGEHLATVVAASTDLALAELPPALRCQVEGALTVLADASTPEGRAFHAADVLDRVLQVRHHARAAAFTVDQALGDMQLVHAGPVQAFHHRTLREAGLWG